ncbi:MAG: hypothetical protein HY903_20190 [Deltaproteobacteria bacterium]|nr:hypothetical protein [Deltaproteobacteria bacterium]
MAAAMFPRTVVAIAVALVASGCGSPVGKNCQADDECGPGFDCFTNVCVAVCTKNDECPPSQTCYRYHCVTPGQERGPGAPAGNAATPRRPEAAAQAPTPQAPALSGRPSMVPAMPDVAAVELRAIRRELELLRQEQAKLLSAVEELRAASTKPAKAAKPATEPKPAPQP